MMDDERFDGLYLNVAQTTQGIEPLLDTVFSFLRRKTDFFAGPPGSINGTQVAIQKVQEVVQKHADLYEKETQKKKAAAKTSGGTQKKKKESKETSTVIEMDTHGGFDISETEKATKQNDTTKSDSTEEAPTPPPPITTTDSSDQNTGAEDTNAASLPPIGNGGTVAGKYIWTQTLAELTVTIPVPENTRGRDLNVTIAKKHLKVGLRSNTGEWIINGNLVKPIICDDSFWTVEDGNRLVISLQKLNQMEWWEGVLEGDPTIDIKKIQPENSSLNDLDGETRKTVGTFFIPKDR
jgi:hypothetical protein